MFKRFKKVGLTAIVSILLIISCSKSPEEQAMAKAKEYIESANKYLKKGSSKGYLMKINKAILTLLKYLQEHPDAKAPIREMFLNTNIELGEFILKNYAADEEAKEKIANIYENINNYIYQIKKDTLVIKKPDGKKIEKVKEEKTPLLNPEAYTKFANFLVMAADTIKAYDGLKDGFLYLKAAQKIDSTSTIIKNALNAWKKEIAQDALERAKEFYSEIEGVKDPEPDPAIAAEYFTRLALKYDPDNKEAQELIHKIYPIMANIYSAYIRVPDYAGIDPEELDDDIDNNDILMAITAMLRQGSSIILEVSLYNNSYNPIEIRPNVFYLVDSQGNKYQALEKNTKEEIPRKILDTEYEEKGKLYFKVPPKADIVKLVYHMERPTPDGGKEIHHSEKYLK